MSLASNEDGLKINWVNYKTGIKHLYFRMEAENKYARIYIEYAHPDPDIRELMFMQLEAYKAILHLELEEEWSWHANHVDDFGKSTTRIEMQLAGKYSIYKPEDWPTLISFFKPRIIALDRFWNMAKYNFDIFK